jgi:hypothetical protein
MISPSLLMENQRQKEEEKSKDKYIDVLVR